MAQGAREAWGGIWAGGRGEQGPGPERWWNEWFGEPGEPEELQQRAWRGSEPPRGLESGAWWGPGNVGLRLRIRADPLRPVWFAPWTWPLSEPSLHRPDQFPENRDASFPQEKLNRDLGTQQLFLALIVPNCDLDQIHLSFRISVSSLEGRFRKGILYSFFQF